MLRFAVFRGLWVGGKIFVTCGRGALGAVMACGMGVRLTCGPKIVYGVRLTCGQKIVYGVWLMNKAEICFDAVNRREMTAITIHDVCCC